MLIKLYELPPADAAAAHPETRCPQAARPRVRCHRRFGSPASSPLVGRVKHAPHSPIDPLTLYVVTKSGSPGGVWWYDATARGFIGPIRVAAGSARSRRRSGLAARLLADAC